ncbi:hypothetical protein NPIL_399561 [Nephila pilipes]|uniref:Uncharacterized protein n=1 Tax=Nephila pilipes TaxID=299642 RepID=A0A8X6Q5C8_NEPPI|nr:hypothetical protein NPIL_399561 [Nephila pilipes]
MKTMHKIPQRNATLRRHTANGTKLDIIVQRDATIYGYVKNSGPVRKPRISIYRVAVLILDILSQAPQHRINECTNGALKYSHTGMSEFHPLKLDFGVLCLVRIHTTFEEVP